MIHVEVSGNAAGQPVKVVQSVVSELLSLHVLCLWSVCRGGRPGEHLQSSTSVQQVCRARLARSTVT